MSPEAFHLPTAADSHQGLDQPQLLAVRRSVPHPDPSVQAAQAQVRNHLMWPRPEERQDRSGPQDEDASEEPAVSAQHPNGARHSLHRGVPGVPATVCTLLSRKSSLDLVPPPFTAGCGFPRGSQLEAWSPVVMLSVVGH